MKHVRQRHEPVSEINSFSFLSLTNRQGNTDQQDKMDKLGLPPLSSLDPLSVAHVGLLLQTTFDVIRATTPKHKPDASEMNKKDTFMSLKLAYGAVPLLAHVTFLTFAAWQSRAILDPATPWSSHPGLRAKHVASCVLALIGARLRLRCFKELGRFFTFGLAIRKEHEVILASRPHVRIVDILTDPIICAGHRIWTIR